MKQVVDIIIPTYNSMPWLEHTLQSVLNQTYKAINVFIIDDGSTDDTERFVQTITDKRVQYIKKQNGGVSSARNFGISKSKAPFIAFLDADDVWVPEKIEKQMALMLQDKKLGLVYGHHYIIDQDNVILGNLRVYKRGNIFSDLCDGNCIAGSASMALIKREVVENLGVFDESLVNGEDWEYWMRISEKYSIDFVPEIIASIRVHTNNAQGNTKKMADGLMQTLDSILARYSLTKNQHVRVSSYCLNNAINAYFSIGDYGSARKATRRLVKENPHALIDGSTWHVHLGFSLILRGLFTNKPFIQFKRFIARLLRLPFWIIRKVKCTFRKAFPWTSRSQ